MEFKMDPNIGYEELDMSAETIPSRVKDGYDFIFMRDRKSDAPYLPMNLLPDTEVGIRFKVEKGVLEAVFFESIPSWADNVGGFTIRIYKWDTDYSTTVLSKAICEKKFENIPDVSELTYVPNEKITEGEYLVLVCEPEDAAGSGIGIYTHAPNVADKRIVEYYVNGKLDSNLGPGGYFVIYLPEKNK